MPAVAHADTTIGLALPAPLPPAAGRQGSVRYLLDAMRLRPTGRRVLSALALTLMVAGGGLLVYPAVTDVYAAAVVQPRLAARYERAVADPAPAPARAPVGAPVTRLVVPRLDLRTVVVEGISPAALRAGAGHYPGTPLPGRPGNVAIAGHRTTYGRPFNRLDELRAGDVLRLETPMAVHTYRVVPAPSTATACPDGACWVTAPDDWSVVDPLDGAMLTLTTCHPKGSAARRLIVRAELVASQPPVAPVR